MKLIKALLACLMLGALSAVAQTNAFYTDKMFDVELTPTLSSYDKYPNSYGVSMETEYWQTQSTGTGLEIGTYDVKSTPGQIDHLAVMEDYRLTPWSTTPILDRLALELKSGAETYFIDGSKDVEVGGGVNVALWLKSSFEISGLDHFRTNTGRDGWTIRAGFKWSFL
jgi:hypothetical protein